MEGMFFYAVVLIVMGVLGWLRRMQEAKADQRRIDEPKTSIDDLPQATRRQLYGDTAQPIRTARPAQRTSQASAPPAIPTARPRQQQTPQRREPQRQQRSQQQPARRQSAAPARPQPQAQQPTMQRMRSALEQMAESVQEQMDQMEGRPAPPPPPARRRKGKSPEQLAAEQAKRQKQSQRQRKAEAARAKRHREIEAAVLKKPSKHLLGNINEIRRGIILAEVLGTPKGLES